MRTAVGPTPRRLTVIPVLLVLLAALALLPVGQWLVDLIIRPVTVSQLVDRRVGLSTRLVAVDGFALLVPFEADPPSEGAASSGSMAYRWYAVRDSLQERRLILVRSSIAAEALQTRTVVARIVDDPGAVSGARAGIVARGGIDPGADLTPWLLDEVDADGQTITEIGSLGELGERSVGDVVRLRLRIEQGIASCVPRGDCRARRLADGIGSWDNLATDPSEGGWVVLRTRYPPSVARFEGVGHHAQDREAVARFLAQPWVHGMLGWGHVLEAAYVEHDLGLPIDRLWLGPILFATLAALLLFGLRLGYPRFRIRGPIGPAGVTATARVAALRCRATGRMTPPGLSPFEVSDAPATLRVMPDGGSLLRMQIGSERREVAIPRALGGLGAIEIGDLVAVGGSLPALQVGWFGSQVLLVFGDPATRDAAAALVR